MWKAKKKWEERRIANEHMNIHAIKWAREKTRRIRALYKTCKPEKSTTSQNSYICHQQIRFFWSNKVPDWTGKVAQWECREKNTRCHTETMNCMGKHMNDSHCWNGTFIPHKCTSFAHIPAHKLLDPYHLAEFKRSAIYIYCNSQ